MYNYLHKAAVAEQINVLYALHILKHFNKKDDKREYLVRQVLNTCVDEYQMMAALHDVKAGNETLRDLFERRGLL